MLNVKGSVVCSFGGNVFAIFFEAEILMIRAYNEKRKRGKYLCYWLENYIINNKVIISRRKREVFCSYCTCEPQEGESLVKMQKAKP